MALNPVDRASGQRWSTQRFVDAFKKQANSRYRLKNWPVLQVANPGLILFATGPPDLGKIHWGIQKGALSRAAVLVPRRTRIQCSARL